MSEVLTLRGWVKAVDLQDSDKVISYNESLDCLEATDVIQIDNGDEEIVSLTNTWDELQCSTNSRWYGWKRKWAKRGEQRGKDFGYFLQADMKQEHNIITSAPYAGGSSKILPHEASLVAWILSDGHYKWSEKASVTSSSHGKRKQLEVSISQAIHKYTAEIESTLAFNGIKYSVAHKPMENGNHVKGYSLSSPDMREFFDRVVGSREQKHDKNWCAWVLSLSPDALNEFVHHFWLADGLTSGHEKLGYMVSQNDGVIQDAIALAMFLQGWKVTLNKTAQKGGQGICRVVRRQRKRHITCQELTKTSNGVQKTFGILTTNKSFVVRQGRVISIVGYNNELKEAA